MINSQDKIYNNLIEEIEQSEQSEQIEQVEKTNKNRKVKKTEKKEDLNIISIEQIDENLKILILSWIAKDEEIKEINENLKEMKDDKKQFENYILEYLEKNNSIKNNTVITTKKGNIIKNVKDSKSAITPDLIQKTLTEILNDKDKAFIYTNEISNKRAVKQNINLKRIIEKKKK